MSFCWRAASTDFRSGLEHGLVRASTVPRGERAIMQPPSPFLALDPLSFALTMRSASSVSLITRGGAASDRRGQSTILRRMLPGHVASRAGRNAKWEAGEGIRAVREGTPLLDEPPPRPLLSYFLTTASQSSSNNSNNTHTHKMKFTTINMMTLFVPLMVGLVLFLAGTAEANCCWVGGCAAGNHSCNPCSSFDICGPYGSCAASYCNHHAMEGVLSSESAAARARKLNQEAVTLRKAEEHLEDRKAAAHHQTGDQDKLVKRNNVMNLFVSHEDVSSLKAGTADRLL